MNNAAYQQLEAMWSYPWPKEGLKGGPKVILEVHLEDTDIGKT